MIRPAHYPASSNALDAAAAQRMVRVTHPFHPWSGREFVFVAVRQTWAEDRVFFLGSEGRQYSLPLGWTDAAPPDVFVAVAAGRCSPEATGHRDRQGLRPAPNERLGSA